MSRLACVNVILNETVCDNTPAGSFKTYEKVTPESESPEQNLERARTGYGRFYLHSSYIYLEI